MDPIVRGWIAVTDRAIDDARDSLSERDVVALRQGLDAGLLQAFNVLAAFESGSRSERIAAAGRLVGMFGDEVGDLRAVEAGLVRKAVQDCCERLRIDETMAERLVETAYGYSLHLSAELHRIAGEPDTNIPAM